MNNQNINKSTPQISYQDIPKKIKRRLYFTGFGYAVCGFLALFLIAFCTNIFTGTINVQQRINYLNQEESFGDINELINDFENSSETTGKNVNDIIKSFSSTLNLLGGTEYKTYRFGYKNKDFPKLSQQYPVYKTIGVMLRKKSLNQYLKSLQIGNVSLKNLSNFNIVSFEVEDKENDGYKIDFDSHTRRLYFYLKNQTEIKAFNGELPSKKQIIKIVDKQLKNLNISMKIFGEGIVDYDHYEMNGFVRVFYPLKFQGYDVRNATTNEQEGITVFYNLNTQKIQNIVNIDIASYEASNYNIKNIKDIESSIEKGGNYYSQGALHEGSTIILLDTMEIVYIDEASEDGNHYFIPTIRGTISSSVENYNGPDVIFQKLI